MKEKTLLENACEANGFTIEVSNGEYVPSGADGWPHVKSFCRVLHNGTLVWEGEYRQGISCLPLVWEEEYRQGISSLPRDMHRHTVHNEERRKECVAGKSLGKWDKPTVADVLYSVLLAGEAFFDALSFQEWAENHGYSVDSIEARKTYRACMETGRTLTRNIERSLLESLRKAAAEY